MSEAGLEYAELMAPAWEIGLADVSDVVSLDAPLIVKWATCQQRVEAELEKVDWESTGLPVGLASAEDEIGERMPLTPREQVKRFLSFNFDDAYKIMSLAAETGSDNGLVTNGTFLEVLKRSKRNLLLPSRLADPDKNRLFYTFQYSDSKEVIAAFDGPVFEGRPIVYDANVGTLDWNTVIRRWAKERFSSDYGCPANGIMTTTEPRIPLTFFFWDRLAEAMYEQPVSS